jgi:hypothetical protein
VATAALFMVVFSLALGAQREAVDGVPFALFLAPGILMMTVIQNAFSNTSSSILISKVQGNIVDTLMPPLSPGELLDGFRRRRRHAGPVRRGGRRARDLSHRRGRARRTRSGRSPS